MTFVNSLIAYGTRYSIRTSATERRQLTTRQSPRVSAIRTNYFQTANSLFVEVTHLGHQNQKRLIHYMHAMTRLTVPTPTKSTLN